MTERDEDFAALFEASQEATRLTQGQTVEGTIVSIGADVALVDVGAKSEAVVDVQELKDDEGRLEVAPGDRIHAVVISTAGGVRLSRRLARAAATEKQIAEAFDAGVPVEGRVEREVKGGYEVRVGRQRAFCPFSQVDTTRVADPAVHLGQTYAFRILEYKAGGRDLVLSRRALLEEEQAAAAEDVRRTLVPGAVVRGRVASVRDFGAFVDLGAGIQGLLHVSEMGWSRVANAAQVLSPDEEIDVTILRVDESTQRIALGRKQLLDDPWAGVAERYAVGDVRSGRVARLAEFGVFVELEPGVDALAHASTFTSGPRRDWARDVPRVGSPVIVEIRNVDPETRRIGVALVSEHDARADRLEEAGAPGTPASEATGAGRTAEPSSAPATPGLGSLADKLRSALTSRDR